MAQMVERQARDLEVQGLVQVQIFLLKSKTLISQDTNYKFASTYQYYFYLFLQVLIDVLDINDNAPSFTKSTYSAVVPENVPIGTDVITMTATDPDEGEGGEIIYDLSNEGEANGLFQINHTTGHIITQKELTGKGRTEPYHLMVRALDGGSPSLSMDVPLSIYIGDVFTNDGVPFFVRPTVNEIAKISEVSV